MITSQILNGMARGLVKKRRFNGLDLAHCLALGTETAYAAVKKPVEGTILTVIREASVAAKTAAERDDAIETVLAATVDAAEKAVAKTPEPAADPARGRRRRLGRAGPLPAVPGGAAVRRRRGRGRVRLRPGSDDGAKPSALVAHADEGFGYETMFLLQPAPGHDLDIDGIRTHLETIGESVVVAGDARAAKVHVHNDRPDGVLAYGLGLGSLSRISVENLDNQARDVRETPGIRVHRPGGVSGDGRDGASDRGGRRPADRRRRRPEAPARRPSVPLAVVAVAAGDGLASIFRDFGVAAVVRGGQSANPSTGELLAAIEAVDADEVLLLPNNPNVVLAARQVAELADRPVHVVPTRNAAEGFSALMALDPGETAAANVADMTERGRGLATLQVTTAVRDAKVSGRKVHKGQTIVLDPDDGLVAADGDPERAVLAAVATLAPGIELVTMFYGDGAELAEAEALARRIADDRPGIEVEVRHGGQPHYRYLISAE